MAPPFGMLSYWNPIRLRWRECFRIHATCSSGLAYRRRSRIEQVVGWYKECRALATRYEKLAVNYVALWMIAIMERLLRKYSKRL